MCDSRVTDEGGGQLSDVVFQPCKSLRLHSPDDLLAV